MAFPGSLAFSLCCTKPQSTPFLRVMTDLRWKFSENSRRYCTIAILTAFMPGAGSSLFPTKKGCFGWKRTSLCRSSIEASRHLSLNEQSSYQKAARKRPGGSRSHLLSYISLAH